MTRIIPLKDCTAQLPTVSKVTIRLFSTTGTFQDQEALFGSSCIEIEISVRIRTLP